MKVFDFANPVFKLNTTFWTLILQNLTALSSELLMSVRFVLVLMVTDPKMVDKNCTMYEVIGLFNLFYFMQVRLK